MCVFFLFDTFLFFITPPAPMTPAARAARRRSGGEINTRDPITRSPLIIQQPR